MLLPLRHDEPVERPSRPLDQNNSPLGLCRLLRKKSGSTTKLLGRLVQVPVQLTMVQVDLSIPTLSLNLMLRHTFPQDSTTCPFHMDKPLLPGTPSRVRKGQTSLVSGILTLSDHLLRFRPRPRLSLRPLCPACTTDPLRPTRCLLPSVTIGEKTRIIIAVHRSTVHQTLSTERSSRPCPTEPCFPLTRHRPRSCSGLSYQATSLCEGLLGLGISL